MEQCIIDTKFKIYISYQDGWRE